jgi:hypothetical protein
MHARRLQGIYRRGHVDLTTAEPEGVAVLDLLARMTVFENAKLDGLTPLAAALAYDFCSFCLFEITAGHAQQPFGRFSVEGAFGLQQAHFCEFQILFR